jgi:hypothetical protein
MGVLAGVDQALHMLFESASNAWGKAIRPLVRLAMAGHPAGRGA